MNAEAELLRSKLAGFLRWERRKRRERSLIALGCYALLAALPLSAALAPAPAAWWTPLVFFAAFSPWAWIKLGWSDLEQTRALVRLDKGLALEERAVTAWDLLGRHDERASALLVLKQAGDRITPLDLRASFGRHYGWQAYLLAPLFLLWLALQWLDVGISMVNQASAPSAFGLAHKVKEFSRELQEKAKVDGLEQSLRLGGELEKIAQRGIDAGTSDDNFKKELAGVAKKLEAGPKSAEGAPPFSVGESRQSLRDLRAELEAAKDLMNLPDGASGSRATEQKWLERLAGLAQLQRQLDRSAPGASGLDQKRLRALLESMEKEVNTELDRRALLDAQQFLEQLMRQGQGEKRDSELRVAGGGEKGAPESPDRAPSPSSQPGKEPGAKASGMQGPPPAAAGAQTQLKGLLGEGDSSTALFKGKPAPGKSAVTPQEVFAAYRRQAEAELNTERVPEGLKETIRSYFLSLERSETIK